MSNNPHQNFNMPLVTLVTSTINDSINSTGEFTMDIETELDTMTFENKPTTNASHSGAKASGFQHGVPSGYYKSTIKDAKHTVHSDGHDVIRITLEVATAPYLGHSFVKYYNLKTKKAVDFFRREMDEIGSLVSSRGELSDLCGTLIGREVLAQIADHVNGNQVILIKRLKASSPAPSANPADLWT